jgi:hypothetical protein
MLTNERFDNPRKLAFDRPSDKLRSFLKKYYNLENFVPQPNNFVVFDEYGLQGTWIHILYLKEICLITNEKIYIDKPTNSHILNTSPNRRHSTPIEKTPTGIYHRHTRSLTPHHHYYPSSPLFNTSPSESNFTSVSSISHSAPPKEIYVQRKRELINQQEHGKQTLYGNNPISWE